MSVHSAEVGAFYQFTCLLYLGDGTLQLGGHEIFYKHAVCCKYSKDTHNTIYNIYTMSEIQDAST